MVPGLRLYRKEGGRQRDPQDPFPGAFFRSSILQISPLCYLNISKEAVDEIQRSNLISKMKRIKEALGDRAKLVLCEKAEDAVGIDYEDISIKHTEEFIKRTKELLCFEYHL